MTNEYLIKHLTIRGVLKTKKIIEAFKHIDRIHFVPKEHKNRAYDDNPLPIGQGQTISQPTTVAFMLELLKPTVGDMILDVGSGSGWTTALLAYIVGETGFVWGVELRNTLVKFGQENIKKSDLSNALILQAGNELGLPDKAPFDKILVSASATKLPQELVDQLKVGGRLVIPIENSIWTIDKVTDSEIYKEEYKGFVFVPLVH